MLRPGLTERRSPAEKAARDVRTAASGIVPRGFTVAALRQLEGERQSPAVALYCSIDGEVDTVANCIALDPLPVVGMPGWAPDEWMVLLADGTKLYSQGRAR